MSRMRRSFRSAAVQALRPSRIPWLLRASQRALRLRLGLPLRAPLFSTLAMTWQCNYRCFMCDFPLRPDAQPSTEELCERVRYLADCGSLALGLTGGEPLVHRGLFEVVEVAQSLGLLVHLNTNGSELTERFLPEIQHSGIHSMNLSLDGACAATHDRLRGAPGSFEQIEQTVALWKQTRGKGSPRLGLVMTVSRDNAGEIDGFLDRAEAWGVHGAGFLPHHRFVDDPAAFEAAEAAELHAALTRAAERSDNSPAYLQGFAAFLAGEETTETCSAPQSHRALDPAGTLYPCVPLMTLGRSGIPWSRRSEELPRPSRADREEVCRRCWWNCHRELDLALRLLRPAAAGGGGGGGAPSSESSPTCSP